MKLLHILSAAVPLVFCLSTHASAPDSVGEIAPAIDSEQVTTGNEPAIKHTRTEAMAGKHAKDHEHRKYQKHEKKHHEKKHEGHHARAAHHKGVK